MGGRVWGGDTGDILVLRRKNMSLVESKFRIKKLMCFFKLSLTEKK